ncbi:phosphoribosylamine--glycine ligase [Fulvivirga sp. RKSG066]|uniref:phosphoribosylamine--glycine ligase n=1 Tax=Fulvivirga aurantia TaxID=2529383 RepID=UPI0012BCCA60|nr:phosphoribosylamine--glycine ligase [Fulvivirga aurantia]MTI22183.1 phosphoribosylamine--glycine ligase [Fulvivirga aurantia]
MNILILGSGGREHTLAWKIAQSEKCSNLYVAPGNAGTTQVAQNVNIKVDDFAAIGNFVLENSIELVVVGPEDPLVKGLRDYFESDSGLREVAFVGPGKKGAQLEGSKNFSKQFMDKHGIPTAKSRSFTAKDINDGLNYLDTCNLPIVLKADGLAAGKGVIICESYQEAKESLKAMLLEQQFGEASETVLVEEFLDGIEVSVFVLTDGKDYIVLPEAKDYKRIGERDTGPNTGGMGAVSPANFANEEFLKKVEKRIIKPTIEGLKKDDIPYKGFIFIGLMSVNDEPYVIEYNVRMGDPETQVVIPRIENDLVDLLLAAAKDKLSSAKINIDPQVTSTVVAVSKGYPGSYEKGKSISGLADVRDGLIIHAGTKADKHKILTNGGRVLAVTGKADTLEDALAISYNGIDHIHWDGMYCRRDIGKDILALHLDS